MPDFCTCGAQLPPDALFCHKCGKPQREIVEPEPVAPVQAPIEPPLAPQVEVRPLNFHNPIALRTALIGAVAATLLLFLPYVNWLAAGFIAVALYRRRTGLLLNVESGIRMGWITGVLTFAITAVIVALALLAVRASGGLVAFQEELKKNMFDPRMIEAVKRLQDPRMVVVAMVQGFVFMTLFSMAGGALGAKMLRRG